MKKEHGYPITVYPVSIALDREREREESKEEKKSIVVIILIIFLLFCNLYRQPATKCNPSIPGYVLCLCAYNFALEPI